MKALLSAQLMTRLAFVSLREVSLELVLGNLSKVQSNMSGILKALPKALHFP